MNNTVKKTMENPRKDKGWNIETCNNRKKKKLFSSRTNLSYYKVSQSKFVDYRNEKKHKYSRINQSIWEFQN